MKWVEIVYGSFIMFLKYFAYVILTDLERRIIFTKNNTATYECIFVYFGFTFMLAVE